LAIGLLLPAGCSAQQPKPAPTEPDPARLERYLRRYFGWPDSVRATVRPFRPSKIQGMLETTVELSRDGEKQESVFLVSSDGQYLVQGPPLALNEDPFAATRSKIDLKEAPARGSPLAPVTIVEYSDWQCGFCRALAPVLTKQILLHFANDVRLYYKDFPLSEMHAWAMPAAQLGRCIYKRYGDAFWDYHDWVFASQPELRPDNFKDKALAFARSKGMDAVPLGSCMSLAESRTEVERQIAEGQSLGVTGTPTMFINGRRVVGAQSFPQLRQIIQAELDHARGK